MIDLNELTKELVDNITEVLEALEIFDYQIYNDRISFPCPIHHGDNEEAVCIFTKGTTQIGNWKCWTRSCQEELVIDTKDGKKIERELGQTLFGFIRGVLREKYGRHVEYGEAIKWSINFTQFDGEYNPKTETLLTYNLQYFNRERKTIPSDITRETIRSRLKIPSSHFLARGFKEETLDRYDVGLCNEQGKEMYQRIVCPFYDDNYKYMVGCLGRTIQPKCSKCNKYHYDNRECPQNKIERRWAQKWLANKGFSSDNYIYNYWFARDHITTTGLAILVEGQPDVWRLEEAGFHMGLGLSGAKLCDNQKLILDESGACNLLILTDSDEAGLEARKKIEIKCKRYYNCHFIDLPKKDIGDMTVDETKILLGNIVERLSL